MSEALAALLEQLGTSDRGLSSAEAEASLARTGPNEFARKSWLENAFELVRSAANPLVLILLTAAGAAAVLGEVADALIIGAIVLLSAGLNLWQTTHSDRAVRTHLSA